MAYETTRIDGDIVHVKITGVMKLADQRAIQAAGMKLIEQGVMPSLMLTLDKFQGWEKGVDWGDVGFMLSEGKNIRKMAIVGDKRWEDEVLVFVGKGIRSTEIEFFPVAAARDAETWIRS